MDGRLNQPNEGEGSTPLEDSSGLKLDYIQTREELNNVEFANFLKAAEKYIPMFSGHKRVDFTYDLLMRIHQEMFGDVWEWAGKIRTTDKGIGIDHYQIREELKKLIDDLSLWISQKWDPVEVAARLHHRLVWIHPFENGNGRWARFIADLYLKQTTGKITGWPSDQIFIQSKFRKKYIEALKKADQGDLACLIEMHKELLGR